MARIADRVKEITLTTGTGNISLAGAADGFRTFAASFGEFDQFYYCVSSDASLEYEVGIGHFLDANKNVIVRDRVLTSSNNNALVNFSAGTKDVMNVLPTEELTPLHEIVTTDTIKSHRPGGLITLAVGAPQYVKLPPSPLATPTVGVRPTPEGWCSKIRNRSGSAITLRRSLAESSATSRVNGARGVVLPDGALAHLMADDTGWRIEGNLTALTPVTNPINTLNSTRFTSPFRADKVRQAGANVFYELASSTMIRARNVSDGSIIATYNSGTAFKDFVPLDDNTGLLVTKDSNFGYVTVLTLSGGTITAGTPVQVVDSQGNGIFNIGFLSRQSATQVVLWWADNVDNFTFLKVITVTGGVPAAGTEVQSPYDFANSAWTSCRLDDTHVAIMAFNGTIFTLDFLSLTDLSTPLVTGTPSSWSASNLAEQVCYFPGIFYDNGLFMLVWGTEDTVNGNKINVSTAIATPTSLGAFSATSVLATYTSNGGNLPIAKFQNDYMVGFAVADSGKFIAFSATSSSATNLFELNASAGEIYFGVVDNMLVVSDATPTVVKFAEEVV